MLTHFPVGYGGSQWWCDLPPYVQHRALVHPSLRPKRWTERSETRRVASDESRSGVSASCPGPRAGWSPSSSQFSGLWYVVAMASDCKVFLGKKDHLLMSTRAVAAGAGGNLSVHMEFPW